MHLGGDQQPVTDAAAIAYFQGRLVTALRHARRFRDMLLRLAARADDYSAADIRAHVADALEISVKELEEMLK